MKQVYRIDNYGYYIEPLFIKDEEKTPNDCVTIAPPNGLFKAQFINGIWVEEMTQSEIDKLVKKSINPTELDILKQENEQLLRRVEEAENAIITLMDLNMNLL